MHGTPTAAAAGGARGSQLRAGLPSGSPGKRLARNVGWLTIARFSDIALNAVFLALVLRALDITEAGKYYAILSFLYLVMLIPEMGMDQALVRMVSKAPHRAAELLGAAVVIRNLVAVVAIGVVAIGTFVAGWESDVRMATIIGAVYVLADFAVKTNNAIYLAFEQTRYELILTLCYAILSVPFVIIALNIAPSVSMVFAAMAPANLITTALGWVITSRRFVKPIFRWDPPVWKEMMGLCLSIGLTHGTYAVYGRIDTQMLLYLTPGGGAMAKTAVAIYNTAFNLVRRGIPLQSIVARPLLPIAVRAAGSPEQLRQIHRFGFTLFLLISVPVCVGIAASSHLLLHLLTGHRAVQYAEAAPLLVFLSVLLLTSFASASFRVIMIALSMQRLMLLHAVIMVVINIILDAILIPYFGRHGIGTWWGPAIGSLVAELYLTAAYLILSSRRVGCFPDWSKMVRILLAGAAMGAAMVVTGRFHMLAALLVGPIVYGVVVLASGAFRPRDLKRLRQQRGRRGEAPSAEAVVEEEGMSV